MKLDHFGLFGGQVGGMMPLFSVDPKLLELLRPDLKLKGGLNKKGEKEIKKF